ncbi:MAG: polysaccharide export outer membrane protein [Phormidesmis priestleyi Ana]|uniref:Polysaccharide export outer membrane protein n=1 Tax=Phormidesmis priestleyi Ana TaxID=1666911 RepID=A0A0N8KNN1_9CYAN|nr:MAG: polysaccharide export outer membrane protein [Phormidesmis priestleyi Ana]
MSRFFAFTTSALATVLITGLDGSVLAQITGQPTNNPNSLPNSISNSLQQPIGQSVSPNPTAALGRSNATYILGAGDQISLSVIGYPEFTGTLAILSDGTITLPLVGPLRVSGLTPNQLSLALTQRLRTYLIDPVVSVGLAVTRPVVVTIAGEVHRPGPIQLSGLSSINSNPLGISGTTAAGTDSLLLDRPALPTLSSAVLLAGGVTRDADIRQVSIRRPLPDGRVENLTLNLWEAMTSDAGIADIGLRDGDTIFIPPLSGDEIDRRTVARSSLAPRTVRVKVVGEVVSPGEVAVPPDSSVSSAVAIAGGPTSDAQLSSVSLVRQDETGKIVEEEIDLRNLVDDYQVQDGDVVVVAKRGYLSVVDGIGRVLNPVNWFRILGF